MQYLGNRSILEIWKIGFLCSRKIPASAVLKCYDWAIEQREKGNCIVSGFHSPIEKEVFQILLKGSQPTIMLLARSMLQKIEPVVKTRIEQGNLLLISIFPGNIRRVTRETALIRNRQLVQMADELVMGYAANDGLMSKLLLDNMADKKISWLK